MKQYALIGIMLLLSWYISSHFGARIESVIGHAHGGKSLLLLFSIVIVFALGFVVYELSKPTIIPSFVLATFFGIVSRDILRFFMASPLSVVTLITIGAIFILFGGGLDTPFRKFKQLVGPILTLSLIGTVITAVLLAYMFNILGGFYGMSLPLIATILLGTSLCSTDPAAIIPSFQSMLFTKPRVKHIAVSESAINDVVGAVLSAIFLGIFLTGIFPTTIAENYLNLLTFRNMLTILRELLVGCGIGLIGYGILQLWSSWKAHMQTQDGSDAALFLMVPLFAYTISTALGGSGYLAVFLSSLLFHIRSHCRHVEHYFNHTIEGFMEPAIFIMLGAMVNPEILWSVANIGIAAGLVFMFILRPLVVLLMMLPFSISKKGFSLSEVLFLCFVRETGVIPAVLLITIQLSGIPVGEEFLSIGLWVILMTLVIQPPLTPLIARKLGIARDHLPKPKRKHSGPVAVLCSRGYSFPERMETVVEWADQHHVENIALLHCPEEKYSEKFLDQVHTRADELFESINTLRSNEEKREISFEFLGGPGLLQDNIEHLIEEGDVAIIFVGSKMLDYRLEDVKRLSVPFFFMN